MSSRVDCDVETFADWGILDRHSSMAHCVLYLTGFEEEPTRLGTQFQRNRLKNAHVLLVYIPVLPVETLWGYKT
jgi:hypothetical protein